MKTPQIKSTIRLIICAAALFLTNRWCLAQDCPSNGAVVIDRTTEETLLPQYQPYPGPSPPILKRYRFVPPGRWPANKTFPTVLMVPPNVFRDENIIDDGTPTEKEASHDLQFAGFLVFQVETRLAPPGSLRGQMDPGYAPEQTDDLKRQILAAINDPQCNGNIYLAGASSGGTLVLWCALDPAPGLVSGWDETARSHIKAVVSMSGPTDFCDLRNLGHIPDEAITRFEDNLDNYVHLMPETDCDHDPNQNLAHASPYWLVTNNATTNPPPIILYCTTGDRVPYSQADDMKTALSIQFPSLHVEKYRMSYEYGSTHDHAFKYWHAVNDDPISDGLCVSQEVITFLLAH